MSSASTVRMALIGGGKFGINLGLQIGKVEGAQLVAVNSRRLTSAEEAAHQLGGRVYESYDDVLAASDIDAVVISTAHGSHHEYAIRAARAGKHVFCEKPMAISVAECRNMIKAAEDSGVCLLIGHSARLHYVSQLALKELESGSLGQPIAMTATRYGFQERHGWWSRRDEYGGMLFSPAIHEIDLMNHILGHPTQVFALAAPRKQPQVDYDDTVFILISYENGSIGSLSASLSDRLDDSVTNELARITCERGSIAWSLQGNPWIEIQPQDGSLILRELPEDYDPWSAVRQEFFNFIDWIASRAAPFITPQEALSAVAVCEAANLSLETGVPQPISLK